MLLRQPAGKLGCRLSADNTVSEVHAGGAAAAAGLKAGWLVKSINGKPVAALEALIKRSVFKFVFEVDKDPPASEPVPGTKRKLQSDPKQPAQKVGKPAAAKKTLTRGNYAQATSLVFHLGPDSLVNRIANCRFERIC